MICGHRFLDDSYCMQAHGHTHPHIHPDDGAKYHDAIRRGEDPLVTKSGHVLTEADIQALADEAEQGYDVEHLKGRPNRRGVTVHPPTDDPALDKFRQESDRRGLYDEQRGQQDRQ